MSHDTILILDFGSQYTQLIARRIREAKVYSEIHPFSMAVADIRALAPRAIVLSGGPSSVYEPGAPQIDPEILGLGVPVLGICYGAQLIAKSLGGEVVAAGNHEYGRAHIRVRSPRGLFSGFGENESVAVWMSHGDRVTKLPPDFQLDAHSEDSPAAAFSSPERKIYCVQFHPEVVHTERGTEVIDNFIAGAKVDRSWSVASFAEEKIAEIQRVTGDSGRVVCGLSGGVDSSVTAAILHRAIGDRLTCIFVDNGLLRAGERDAVAEMFGDHFVAELRVIDAEAEFLAALADTTDPEKKRKIIGNLFVRVFEKEARSIPEAKWLAQGTLYPDVIESVSFKGGPSVVIKSHHNVGGLPEDMELALIEPLRELFKDEVRALGEKLGLPRRMLARHPFPGPGLAVRCLGAITAERLASLRAADAIVDEEIRKAGLYDELWQAFGVLLPVSSVGVMGDKRTYAEALCVRAVTSVDGMTADWAKLPHEVLDVIARRVVNQVRGINRVVYDVTSKPPGTIEWE
ncbi:MAG TPA: glutamine-hydrolyzing GMP synthase [Kofleriaceae bacterium]|nr:glutamine-hydrolyzing GMP synthase [Kofleriaceae bacterium]